MTAILFILLLLTLPSGRHVDVDDEPKGDRREEAEDDHPAQRFIRCVGYTPTNALAVSCHLFVDLM
jgi:hypothetical protein